MSVSAIAQQVGMTESDLRSINNIPPRMLVKAGSALVVPRSAKMDDVTGQVADHAQLSLSPEIVNRKAVVKAGRKDSVASIAARYKLSAASVADWNDVKPGALFKAGQAITVYLPVTVRPVAQRSAGATAGTRARATPAMVKNISRNPSNTVVRKARKK
jgi:membrane-bound lytic murein transglycosylase D